MDRERIARLINFDDGEDTSTGFVSAGAGSGIDEELTERLRETMNNVRDVPGTTIDICDSRWRNVVIDAYDVAVMTNGDVELTVLENVLSPVDIVIYIRNLFKIVPDIRRLIIDCKFNHDATNNSCVEIRNGLDDEGAIDFFEKHIWFRSGTPNRLITGRYTAFDSVRGGMYYVPDYDPHKKCPAKLTTNFLN